MEQADQMRPRLNVERQQNGGHIVLDSAQRQFGGLADFLIAAPLEYQLQDLQVARSELGDTVVVRGAGKAGKRSEIVAGAALSAAATATAGPP